MRLSIGGKLLGIFGAAMFSLILISITAYWQTTELITTSEWVLHTQKVLSTLSDTLSALKDAETGQRGFVITGAERYLEPYEEGIKKINDGLSELKTLVADSPQQAQRLEVLSQASQKKLAELKRTVELRKTVGFEKTQKEILTDHGKTYMDEARKAAREMEGEETVLLGKRNNENKKRADETKFAIILGIIVCLAIFIISGFFIFKHISEPLKEITLLADQLATGNLSIKVSPHQRSDEIGKLSKSFGSMITYFIEMSTILDGVSQQNLTAKLTPASSQDVIGNSLLKMIGSLRNVANQLKDGSNILATSSSEILAVVSQVVAGASETAAAVSQTTATVEEVRQTAQVSSQKAKGVSESAKVAAEISQKGKKAVEASIEGMTLIKKRMESITENILKLSEQSQTIGEIISTVNDLAEQSNLLAVNASIEAARAGEQGKGFVVVAHEVKLLADQSKHATSQIRGILNEIQKATGAAVMAAEQGGKAVEAGILQVDESGNSILALSEKVALAAQAAIQIAASSEQQVAGVSQVASAMENIKQATSQNVAATRQVEAAAQDLNKVGQNLKELVNQFKM